MKDKNGINIDCQNCEAFEYCKDSSAYKQCQNKAFSPSKEAYESRIKELQDELYADKYNYESWEEIKEEHQKLEATIVKLQNELNIVQESERAEAQEADRLRAEVKELKKENALLKDGESHIMEVKMSPKLVKSIIRAANSEIRDLKEELRFTDEEINLIRNTFQELIWEDECDGSAEKKIIDKCYAILKAKESEEK